MFMSTTEKHLSFMSLSLLHLTSLYLTQLPSCASPVANWPRPLLQVFEPTFPSLLYHINLYCVMVVGVTEVMSHKVPCEDTAV